MVKNIEKWSLRYALVKSFVFMFFRLSFRKFSISGIENIPKNKPVILAPNHQNALTDALAIVFSLKGQPVFLSRADIFKNKIAAYFLTIFKLKPVYRIRDGKESLGNNQDTFDSSIRVLMNNKTLCLFPEAAHIGMKSMLPHKKAIPRIAFLTGEKTNFEIDLNIIPVGINYTHYSKFRSDLVVHYGPPISLHEYYNIYQSEGEVKATQALKDKIFGELTKLCIHVPDKEDYDIYEQGFEIYSRKECERLNLKISPVNLVKAEQSIILKLKSYFDQHLAEKEELLEASRNYKRLKIDLNISEESLIINSLQWIDIVKSIFLFLILLPFSLMGFILHGWLFWITHYSFRKKIKDPQFFSTFSLGLSVVLFPFWFVIFFVLSCSIFKSWILALVFVFISIPCGIIAWEILQLAYRMLNRFRFFQLKKARDVNVVKLIEKRLFLASKFDKILN